MNTEQNSNPQPKLKDLINQSSRVLVACGKNPRPDSVAASLGLSATLEGLGKTVNLVCSDQLPGEAKSLLGWEKIGKDLTKNFVITLKSAVGNVEKVSYYTEGDNLNLVIHPHSHAPSFSPDQVEYKKGGGDYDLIFVLGTERLSDLGKLYTEEKDAFEKAAIINVDKNKDNTQFGKLNLVYPETSSLSEIVTRLLKNLGAQVKREAASNLLAGIVWATHDFRSPDASAQTFEAAAFCLRSGAQRLKVTTQLKQVPKDTSGGKKKDESFPKDTQPEQAWLEPKIYQGGKLV